MNPPEGGLTVETTQRAQPKAPPVPRTVKETGLSERMIAGLLLKSLYVQGARTGRQLTELTRLPFTLVDEQLLSLQQRHLIQATGSGATGRGGYTFELTTEGASRAREALDSSQYVGPAPVPLSQFRAWVAHQSITRARIGPEQIRKGLAAITLDDLTYDLLGPAINSAHSMFLYGEAGNGKTMIAETVARLLGGAIYVPYAVDIDGHTMVLHDPVYHRPAEPEKREARLAGGSPNWLQEAPAYDQRFTYVHRPTVIAGGELTLEQLDLQYDHHSKMYQAPFQLKAAGGVLIIDDFGRQRVHPRDLLNRWIVPLEKRVDFLTLHTGIKFPVPFDCLLVFSTNIAPNDLADEAFLRRIQYKIHIHGPTREGYEEIFERCCAEREIDYDPAAVEYLYRRYYSLDRINPRGCHPRDLLNHICDAARFRGVRPELTESLIDQACHSYFVSIS